MKALDCSVNRASNTARRAVGILSIVTLLLVVSLPLFSQSAVGTILGGVFDSSGGAIAGAKVTIIDVARGTTRALTTDDAGEYTAPTLLSGTYTVRAEAKGFQTLERQNVLLEVAQSVRVDLTLAPGEQTQTVTVTEEIPAIDTTNATLGGDVTNQSISSLPLITRNFLQLLQLRPGVVDVPGGTGTATVTNGRRAGADVLLVEGVTQFDLATSNLLINGSEQGGGVNQLPLDAIQEFSTQQNPPAEYGWRDGSAINVGVKSGTNSIHGSAYAFGRDAGATDARTYSATGIESVNQLTVEQPGFSLGGPAIKNKLFWFVSAEFIRQSVINTAGITTPADVTAVGSALGTGNGCGSTALKTTTPGNCTADMVDACNDLLNQHIAINPLSAQIAGLPPGSCTPQPATSTFENLFPYNPTNSQTFFPYPVTTSPSNDGVAKVDWNPSEHQHVDGFFYISKETNTAPGTLQPYWGLNGTTNIEEYAGAWTWTPNSSWVNELRGGATPNSGFGQGGDFGRLPVNPYPAGYSINTGVTDPALADAPCIIITQVYGATSGLGVCSSGRGKRGPQFQLDFSDKVSHVFGNHSIKFGYEQVFVVFDNNVLGYNNGDITFPNLENFLTGTITAANIAYGDFNQYEREQWHAAFIQDTWRVTRRITLTPGIRWEYIGSPHSIYNVLGNFDPNVPGGVDQCGPGLPCSTQIHPQKDNFNPRMGVAWDIFGNGKTVLRAGVGNLSSFPAILTVTGGAGTTAPFGATLCTGPCTTAGGALIPGNIVINRFGTVQNADTSATLVPNAAIAPNWTTTCTNPLMTATCSGPALFPVGTAVSATSGPQCTNASQCSFLAVDPNLKNPKSLQWNVDIQRAITNNLTLDVAYVGTHGYDEIGSTDVNQPPNGTGWDLAPGQSGAAAANCIKTINMSAFTSACTTSGTTPVEDLAAIAAARPYATEFPYFEYIAKTVNEFHSNYNGLQVTANSRPYHGLNFLATYTLSHALDDWTKSSQATAALANPANPQYQYGNSDMDVRHRLRVAGTYMIPGIKTPGQMLEGWSINPIWAWQSGFAWGPDDATTNDWVGNGENLDSAIPTPNNGVWQSWNYSGPHSAFNGNGANPIPCYGALTGCTAFTKTPAAILANCEGAAQAPYSATQQQQLALAALFSAKGACYIQNGGILTPPAYGTLGDASRGLFSGPHYQDVDLAVEKLWHVKERYSAQLRIECYNVFNHVNFAQFSGTSNPATGGGVQGVSGFGFHTTAQGTLTTNRAFQFGLKLIF